METDLEGFYAAYLSGAGGQGLLMFVIRGNHIVGADTSGGLFDGNYRDVTPATMEVTILVKTPPNVSLVAGGDSGPAGLESNQQFPLPKDFASQPFVRIEGPRGPMNAKFVKLRGLE